MKILHLILKAKWYDMIATGEKTEEYRDFNPYWCNRLICKGGVRWWNKHFENEPIERIINTWANIISESSTKDPYGYNAICFHRGYTNTTMDFEYDSLNIGKGNKEWGAPEESVFIIKLGKKLNK